MVADLRKRKRRKEKEKENENETVETISEVDIHLWPATRLWPQLVWLMEVPPKVLLRLTSPYSTWSIIKSEERRSTFSLFLCFSLTPDGDLNSHQGTIKVSPSLHIHLKWLYLWAEGKICLYHPKKQVSFLSDSLFRHRATCRLKAQREGHTKIYQVSVKVLKSSKLSLEQVKLTCNWVQQLNKKK